MASALVLLATACACGALAANGTGNTSKLVRMGNTSRVAHVHLSLSGSGQMVVTWSAAVANATGSGNQSRPGGELSDGRPCVRHARAGQDISTGNMTPAKNVSLWRDRVWSVAEISGLTAGAPYDYQCSSSHGLSHGLALSPSHRESHTEVKEFGPQLQMRLPLSADLELGSASRRPVRLAILGDMPVVERGPSVVERILGGPLVDAALHLGDIGGNLSAEDGQMGERFLHMVEPLASGVPYMTLRGDDDDPAAYARLFHMPSTDNDTWYSLAIGPARLLALDTNPLVEASLSPGQNSRQLAWLEKELAVANTPTKRWWRPWVIVAGHHPLYCSMEQPTCGLQSQRLRAMLEPLLRRHRVDLYLSAHLHAYERTFPVANGSLCSSEAHDSSSVPNSAACAPVYVVNGDAGIPALEYETLPARWTAQRHPGTAGHGELTLHNRTHLQYRQVAAASGIASDEFWLFRDVEEKPTSEPEEENFLEAISWLALATVSVTGTCTFMRWSHSDGLKRREQALQSLRVELAVLSGVPSKVLGTAREVESLVQQDGKGSSSMLH